MKNSHSHRWLIFFEVILLIIAFLAAVFLILAGIGPSWQKPEVSVKMQNASEIDPNNAVVLSFSQSVKTSKIEQGFKVSPSADVSLAWKNNNTELEIKPVDYFEPGKEYTLEFPVPRGILGLGKEILNLKYKVRDFPQVTYVVPEKDEASISIDSDFKITFDHSVHDFNINFEMDPEGAF